MVKLTIDDIKNANTVILRVQALLGHIELTKIIGDEETEDITHLGYELIDPSVQLSQYIYNAMHSIPEDRSIYLRLNDKQKLKFRSCTIYNRRKYVIQLFESKYQNVVILEEEIENDTDSWGHFKEKKLIKILKYGVKERKRIEFDAFDGYLHELRNDLGRYRTTCINCSKRWKGGCEEYKSLTETLPAIQINGDLFKELIYHTYRDCCVFTKKVNTPNGKLLL